MKRFRPILNIPVVYRNLFHPLKASTVTISVAESTIDYGDDAVITVSIPQYATGLVECIIGNEYYSKQLISTAGSNAVFTVSGLTFGTKPIVVNYLGNNEYGSCNGSSTITINRINTDINIIDQGNGTIIVKLDEDVTGTVNLKYQDSIIQTRTLNSESYCEFDVTNLLSPGTRSVTIEYLGDQYYSSCTKNETIEVPKYNTEMTVEAQNSTVGSNILITITLPAGATGTVTLELDGVQNSVNVNSYGTTTTTISSGVAGNKTILASYSGDNNYMSQNTTANVVVSKSQPVFKVTLPAQPPEGRQFNITYTLPSEATGTVTATINGNSYTGSVVNNKVRINIPGLAAGTYQVTSLYSGDDMYMPAESLDTLKVVASSAPIS